MKQILIPAVMLTLVITVLTGLVYPLVVTGLSQVFFAHQANGSLIEVNGKIVGSALIGQKLPNRSISTDVRRQRAMATTPLTPGQLTWGLPIRPW